MPIDAKASFQTLLPPPSVPHNAVDSAPPAGNAALVRAYTPDNFLPSHRPAKQKSLIHQLKQGMSCPKEIHADSRLGRGGQLWPPQQPPEHTHTRTAISRMAFQIKPSAAWSRAGQGSPSSTQGGIRVLPLSSPSPPPPSK